MNISEFAMKMVPVSNACNSIHAVQCFWKANKEYPHFCGPAGEEISNWVCKTLYRPVLSQMIIWMSILLLPGRNMLPVHCPFTLIVCIFWGEIKKIQISHLSWRKVRRDSRWCKLLSQYPANFWIRGQQFFVVLSSLVYISEVRWTALPKFSFSSLQRH